MNRLTVQALARRIASTLGITPEAAEQLIHDYFVDVAERLQRGETVDIDNLGKFAAGGESLFTPLPDVAARINEPFAFFEPVELNDGVTAETLDLTAPAIPEPEPAPEPERIEEPEPEPEPEKIEEPAPAEPEIPEAPEAPEAPIIPNFPQAPEPSEPLKGHCANALAAWATGCLLLGLTIGGLTGYWVGRHTTLFPTSPAEPVEKVEPITTLNDTSATSITSATSATSATPVTTDTVRADYYITDMARKYYGNKDFWSYIYEENADSLGHPEHIHPGQILVIPDAAKYGIDPENKESLKRARALAIDIYGRYN